MSLKQTKHSFLSLFKLLLLLLLLFSCIWTSLCIINLYPYQYKHQYEYQESNEYQEYQESEKRSLQIATDISNDNYIDIILCSDQKDRFPMYVLINSIIQNEKFKDTLFFHILVDDNIPLFVNEFSRYFGQYFDKISFEFKSIKQHIPSCIEYHNIASQTLPDKQKRNWLNNIMNFARFCAPNAFKSVNLAIYIDVDTIVQNSISLLYKQYYDNYDDDNNDKIAWSVLNRRAYKSTFRKKEKSDFLNNYLNNNLSILYPSIPSKPINFTKIKYLFNAGILMFNFEIWRKNNFTEQSIELFKFNNIFKEKFKNKPWTGVTQPIFNMIFIVNNIKIRNLAKEWNLVIKDLIGSNCKKKLSKSIKKILSKQNMIHFAGSCKPWIYGNKLNTNYLWIKYIPNNANKTLFYQT